MAKKSSEEKVIDKKIKEEYSLKVQDLMDLIPQSNVFKRVNTFAESGVVFYTTIWTVGEYTVDSDFHLVCSIEADDKQQPQFRLKAKDYRNFVKACEQRKADILNQRKAQKSKEPRPHVCAVLFWQPQTDCSLRSPHVRRELRNARSCQLSCRTYISHPWSWAK